MAKAKKKTGKKKKLLERARATLRRMLARHHAAR
jgi:hypothetical protein